MAKIDIRVVSKMGCIIYRTASLIGMKEKSQQSKIYLDNIFNIAFNVVYDKKRTSI